jgi:hypothetical protein
MMDFMPGGLHRACKVASLCHILGSKIMKLLRSWFLIGALTGLMLATSIPAKSMPGQPPAKISPPEVFFQVTATRDTVNRGDTLDFVCSVANHSQILLEKLEIMPLPQRPEINLSMPAWQSVPAFGSETNQATGKVTDNADFGMHHLVFVLKYTWKGDSATYTSTQAATVNVLVNRQFEEEAKGLPGGTAALLYLILPVVTIFLSYGFLDSWRREGKPTIPEFKSEYIAPAFLGAIVLNFVLIYERQQDQSYLYSTPKRFALSLLLLAVVGAVIPLFRWLIQGVKSALYTLRKTDNHEKYLRKVLHQSPTGDVTWKKAKIDGVEWQGALLRQPSGTKVLGACLQISADVGKLKAEELKSIVNETGTIADLKKLLQLLNAGSVSLKFSKRITESGGKKDMLFVENQDMELLSEGSEPEKIVKFVQ